MNDKLFTDAKTVDLFDCLTPEEKARADYKGMIASAILKKRIELGFSQAELASYLHVSQSTVSKWESGDYNFSLDKLAHPLSHLGLTMVIIGGAIINE